MFSDQWTWSALVQVGLSEHDTRVRTIQQVSLGPEVSQEVNNGEF